MRERGIAQRRYPGDDLTVFNQLVAMHQAAAFNLAYRLLGNRRGAEIVVEESVLQLLQRLGEYPEDAFLCWLLRLVAGKCRDLHVDRVPRSPVPADRIEEGLRLLPFEQRLALLLSDMHRLSRQEVAFIMNVPEEMARAAVTSARSALRHFLFGLSVTSPGSVQVDKVA
jgi:DNA-directed RNA polymerase specialized sigma24 family protein